MTRGRGKWIIVGTAVATVSSWAMLTPPFAQAQRLPAEVIALESTPATSQSAVAQAKQPDVIYVPTPQERVDAMLKMARLKKGEKIYDLGCGDGRIAVSAARDYGARAVCVEIDPVRLAEARTNVKNAKVEKLVEVRQQDLFETDFSDADVVTLYLLPDLNERLKPKLQGALRPGSRVVSHAFDMGTWKPDKQMDVAGAPLYLWVIPAKR